MSFRVVWSQIASIFAAAVPLMIVKRFSNPKMGWSVTGAIFGFFCIFPILLTWRLTRGWERYVEETEPLNFKDLSRAICGNRSFRYIVGIYLFSTTAVYASGSIAMYFLEYWMNFSENQISLFFLFFFVCTVLWVPVITLVSKWVGKRGAFMLLMAFWASAYGIGNLVIRPHHVVLMYLLAALGAVGAAGSFLLCYSMIADVVEVDEFKTGKRREGLYYGVVTFVQKMGSALALLILGQVLERIGYVPNAVQSARVLLGLRIMFGPVLAGLIVASVIIAYFLPMTRERHKALLEAIESKRSGAAWDETGFKELL
jgi:Na+/melibiose symporter-like transporter